MQIVSSFFVSQKKEAPRSSSEAKKVLLEPFQRRLLRIAYSIRYALLLLSASTAFQPEPRLRNGISLTLLKRSFQDASHKSNRWN
jgi:hypothetical protein